MPRKNVLRCSLRDLVKAGPKLFIPTLPTQSILS